MSGYDVLVAPVSDVAVINVRAQPGSIDAIGNALGCEPPRRMFAAALAQGVRACRLGPDQWWVLCELAQEVAVCGQLDAALAGTHAAVTAVSDQYSGFALHGSEVGMVMRQAVTIDLDDYGDDCATRCGFARCSAFIYVHTRSSRYEIYVESSYADYVSRWLSTASAVATTA